MRVALVYNQKKEDATQQSLSDEATEPPSLIGAAVQASSRTIHPQLSSARFTDLYAEWDTFETIDAVRHALAEVHDVIMIEGNEDAYEKLRSERPDIAFNITEGLYGASREAQLPAMLEMLQIPYTGSDPLTLAICLDKSRAKEILSYYNIATPRFGVVNHRSEIGKFSAMYPCMVKPLHEGSSKGIYNSSLVNTRAELQQEVCKILETYDEPAIIEEYLAGREFTVAILGNGSDLTALPIVEIKFDSLPDGVNPLYSFEAKWIWDRSDAPLDIFACPAQISPKLRNEIETICRKAYTVLKCRDWSRIDVRLDVQGIPHIIELNPLPGILPNPEDNSCFPKAARAAGMNYNQLIQTVLAIAAQRHGLLTPARSFQPTI